MPRTRRLSCLLALSARAPAAGRPRGLGKGAWAPPIPPRHSNSTLPLLTFHPDGRPPPRSRRTPTRPSRFCCRPGTAPSRSAPRQATARTTSSSRATSRLRRKGGANFAHLRFDAGFSGAPKGFLAGYLIRASAPVHNPGYTGVSYYMLSIVIPIHNEEPSILPLYDRLTAVADALGRPYEILFVDDASTDRSFELLANLVETDGHLKVIRLRRNFGQTAALSAGFHEAQGDIVVAMDGDLQHAPEDIPALLAKIDEGYDIASGWRKHRVDNALSRKLPSRIANWLMAKASGVDLRDFGTTFKAYRAEILKDVNLYGELHR